MRKAQFNYGYQIKPQPAPKVPIPQPPKYRFRWNLIWIAIVILVLLFLFNGMEPALTFDELAYQIGIENTDRWRRFCTWWVVGLAIVLVVRIFIKNKKQ